MTRRIVVRIYRPKRIELGPLELTVLELERVDELSTSRDLAEILSDYVERYQGSRKLIEVSCSEGSTDYLLSSYTSAFKKSRSRYQTLYLRPARLYEVGVKIKGVWRWFKPSTELYIYEGEIRVKDSSCDPDIILIKTDDGIRRVSIKSLKPQ